MKKTLKYPLPDHPRESTYQALFKLDHDAILILHPADGRIVDANNACLTMLGYDRNELITKYFSDLLFNNSKWSGDSMEMKADDQECIKTREEDFRHKDGHAVPVQLTGIRFEVQGDKLFFLIARNLSDLREKEIALQESDARYRELVEKTGEGIGLVDENENFTYTNAAACEIFGLPHDQLVGKNLFSFLDPSFREKIMQETALRHAGHQSFYELEIIRPDGGKRWIVVTATPRYNRDRVFTGTFGIFRDITERKLYEQELIIAKEKAEESDRLKSSILANISHELRTPLNGILGFSEILIEELKGKELCYMVENIRSSGNRLMETLNAIITLSQLEAGKINVVQKEFQADKVVVQIVRSFLKAASDKNITIVTSQVKPFRMVTDEFLFRQLMQQILDNAIKFTTNGVINIETHYAHIGEKGYIVTRVADTGIGIEKSYFDLIFQEFRQVSEGFGRKYQGSGIGLTISKKIIDLLHGQITVESEPGKGSVFSIWIPDIAGSMNSEIAVMKEKPAAPPDEPAPVHTPPSVLLVEDNIVNKELTEHFLQPNYKVDHAKNGAVAIEMARKSHYAAILMDINLGPGITGIDVTRAIRQIEGYAEIPIIAVTGYALPDDQESMIHEGFSMIISKPFTRAKLIMSLQSALQGGSKESC